MKQLNILVVDDDQVDVMNVQRAFKKTNIANPIFTAGDGIEVKDNLLFSALNSKSPGAYPITYQSWVIVYAKQLDKAKGAALKAYIKYLVSDGQKFLKELDFAPLPKSPRSSRSYSSTRDIHPSPAIHPGRATYSGRATCSGHQA